METLNLIITLLLFAALLYGIQKKLNLATLLFFVSLAGLAYMTLTGTVLLEDGSSGNPFFDIFEYIYVQMQNGIAGTVLTVLMIFGYLEIMTHIHATDTLASKASHLLSGIRNPYLLASFTVVLGAFLKIGITVGPNIAMLMVASLYPVLIASGCSKKTAASAMHTYCFLTWGPADTANYTGLSLMGLHDVSVAEWFVKNQIPVNVCSVLTAAVIFYFTSRYFDRKESALSEASDSDSNTITTDAPGYFAVLPLLPLIFVLIFSTLIAKTVIISVVGSVLLSTCISVLAYILHKRNPKEGVDLFAELYNGMGNGLKGLGVIILFGTIFAGIMGKIGGMKEIVALLANLHMNSVAFVMILSVLSFAITWIIGTFLGAISMCIPLATTIAAATGMNPTGLLHLTLIACGCGVALSPIQSGNIVVASATGLESIDIVKRNAIPIIGGFVVSVMVSLLFFL